MAAPRRRSRSSSFTFWRFQMPLTIAVLIGVTLIASIVAAVGGRNGFPLGTWTYFAPALVWRGEVWRLVTWVFIEGDPISLVFGILMLYWFGKDLCEAWGARRFLAVYLGMAAACAVVTCLVGRFLWAEVMEVPHLGSWAVLDALIIAWALRFPEREIRIYFVLPASGRVLIYITLGGTVLYALYMGLVMFIPHFAAEGLILLSALSFRRQFLKFRQGRLKRQMRRYVDNVRRIDGKDDDDEGSGGGGDEPPPRKWVN